MKTLTYGKRQFSYSLVRRERKTLEISVYPDCEVEVVAPIGASEAKIEERVRRRLKWISRQQRLFENFYPKPSSREYVSGESWLYQGRQYRLRVIEAKNSPKVALRRPMLVVEANDKKNRSEVQKLLSAWYRKRAEIRLVDRYSECSRFAKKFGIKAPAMRIQKMTKRWGSYSPSGRILLNPELVKVPTECIDYVILHELCHVQFRSHAKPFYELLNRMVPDCMRLKLRLEHLLL